MGHGVQCAVKLGSGVGQVDYIQPSNTIVLVMGWE